MRVKMPSPAMAVAVVALFVALGGTGYAASELSHGSSTAIRPERRSATIAVLVRKAVAAYFKAHAATLRGPRGIRGLPGQPGIPGTAFAYAHINADGTLDGANSKNVTVLSHYATGQYCLKVTGTPRNAVVTDGAPTAITISDVQGVPYVDLTQFTGCPAGTNLKIVMGRLSGLGTSDWPFYITIN